MAASSRMLISIYSGEEERAELFDPEDVTRNIGLRMVSRIAKSMEYQNMLGRNVLTIKV